MRNFRYAARLLRGDQPGSWVVRFRDLPEAITWGASRPEAIEMAQDCLEEVIAARMVEGRPLPLPSKERRGEVLVSLGAGMAAKAALCVALDQSGLTNVAFARKLGVDEKEVRRMLNPKHATRLSRIQSALSVLGKRLSVGLDDLAA